MEQENNNNNTNSDTPPPLICEVDGTCCLYVCGYHDIGQMVKDVNASPNTSNMRIIVMENELAKGKSLQKAFHELATATTCTMSDTVKMLELRVYASGVLDKIFVPFGTANFPCLTGLKINHGLAIDDLSLISDFARQHPTLVALDISENPIFKTHHHNEDEETYKVCTFIRSLNCLSNVEELGLINCNTAVSIIGSIRDNCANKDGVRDRWRIKKLYLESVYMNEMPKITGNQDAKVHRVAREDQEIDFHEFY
jgi:hypothetical protein